MNGIRFCWSTILVLLLTVALVEPCSAQVAKVKRGAATSVAGQERHAESTPALDKHGQICTVYSLAEFAHDPKLGDWIACTMPTVIQPGSWNTDGGSGVLSYFAPTKTMVVYHTPSVHTQVEAFLKSVKKSMPPASAVMKRTMSLDQGVAPAQFIVSDLNRAVGQAPAGKSAYPIPAPLQQPKHLFHFIIRYEGDGAVDAGVAALAKVLSGETPAAEEQSDRAPAEPTKPGSLSQLFNIILRYEGDGIIDENVAAVIKTFQGEKISPAGMVQCAPGDPVLGRGPICISSTPVYTQGQPTTAPPAAGVAPAASQPATTEKLPYVPSTRDVPVNPGTGAAAPPASSRAVIPAPNGVPSAAPPAVKQ